MSIEKRFEQIDQILNRTGAKINQKIQDANSLIEGISQYLNWLVFDKLHLIHFAITSETEIRVNNANIALNLVSYSVQDQIQGLNEGVCLSVSDRLANIKHFIQVTLELVEETMNARIYTTTQFWLDILNDIASYYSPEILVQVAGQTLLLDKMKEIFAPTPEQVLAFNEKFQDARLKSQEKLWDKVKPEELPESDD